MNDLDFTGKRVLVVGGSSGIGNGIAHAFLERGAKVTVWGTRASAEDYAGEPGSDLSGLDYVGVDVSSPEAVAAVPFDGEPLDVFVACQGTVIYGRGEFEMEGFEKVVDVNLNSVMACALKFREAVAKAGGSMILISSTAAIRTVIANPAYNASKAGMLGLTRSLAQAWIGDGIRVNGVAPGLVETKLTRIMTQDPKRRDAQLKVIPRGRLGTPADIAGTVLFLASPLADYVIGQTIVVDGGNTL